MTIVSGPLIWEIVKKKNSFLVKEFENGTSTQRATTISTISTQLLFQVQQRQRMSYVGWQRMFKIRLQIITTCLIWIEKISRSSAGSDSESRTISLLLNRCFCPIILGFYFLKTIIYEKCYLDNNLETILFFISFCQIIKLEMCLSSFDQIQLNLLKYHKLK